MEILPLLGKRLKDDVIIKLLDDWDVEVTYDFDRSHENIEDVYWAQAKDHGITMRFDEKQTLDTVFVYLEPIDGHTPVSPAILEDVHPLNTISDVEQHTVGRSIAFKKGFRPAGLPPAGEWANGSDSTTLDTKCTTTFAMLNFTFSRFPPLVTRNEQLIAGPDRSEPATAC
jgi:hypothetical protein